jgi:hypothetical protein
MNDKISNLKAMFSAAVLGTVTMLSTVGAHAATYDITVDPVTIDTNTFVK